MPLELINYSSDEKEYISNMLSLLHPSILQVLLSASVVPNYMPNDIKMIFLAFIGYFIKSLNKKTEIFKVT